MGFSQNMASVRRGLESVDALLNKVFVSGDNVFLLANARNGLKITYDALKGIENGEQGDRGTPVDCDS